MNKYSNTYKNTLLMPKTEFSMKANLPAMEPLYQKMWVDENIYERALDKNANGSLFILHDGPTFSLSEVTIGQAVNKVLKDIIIRYKLMSHHYAPFYTGWDTHSIYVANAVSRKNDVSRSAMDAVEFRKLCYDYVYKQVSSQKFQLQRLGLLDDWSKTYLTLDRNYESKQLMILAQMVKKNLIYEGLKSVYWSVSTESILPETDVEYTLTELQSIYFTFNVIEGRGVISPDCELVVWTMIPWSIFGNMALTVATNATYVVMLVKDKYYVIAKDMVAKFASNVGIVDYKIVREFPGKSLEYVTYYNSFNRRTLKVITSNTMSIDDGTGIHLTAPGHGDIDFHYCKPYNIEVICPVDTKGYLTEEAYEYKGIFYWDVVAKVIEQLDASKNLIKATTVLYTFPHNWRTKEPVLYRTTKQWFVSIDKIRDQIIKTIKEINWIPQWAQENMVKIIADKDDWCISRQQTWGLPIPALYAEDKTVILDEEIIKHVASIVSAEGSNAWYEHDVKDLLPPGYTNPHSPNGIFTKEMDTFDIWFDSGVSFDAAFEQTRPSIDLYVEGIDQFRNWFTSTLIISAAIDNASPFKTGYVHNFATLKKKTSNSSINIKEVEQKYGADILRLWVVGIQSKGNIDLNERVINQNGDVYVKIRNTFRFMLGNLFDFSSDSDRVEYNSMPEFDQYMVNLLNKLVEDTLNSYENYDFDKIYRDILNHVINNLSAYYLDISKDILYMSVHNSLARRSIQTVLFDTVFVIARLLAPIIPHTAEEIYMHINMPNKQSSIFLTDMPIVSKYANTSEILTKYTEFEDIHRDILKALEIARSKKVIRRSEEAIVTLKPNESIVKLLYSIKADLRKILKIAELVITLEDINGDYFACGEIKVKQSEGQLCSRCRQISKQLNIDSLCERCADVVQ